MHARLCSPSSPHPRAAERTAAVASCCASPRLSPLPRVPVGRAANETRGARPDDPSGILEITDVVIDQRPVECLFWVTSSGLIMSWLGQVSLTKPTYRRIVLRCCSVPQAKPSPDYEYRISLRPHPVGHPSSSTRDSASRAVPSSIRVRRDGYREAGEWQQGRRRSARARLRRSLPEPDPENRAAISIGSARPAGWDGAAPG